MENLAMLRALALSGGTWVLYFLTACSVLSIAVILERAVYFLRHRDPDQRLQDQVLAALLNGHWEQALTIALKGKTPVARTFVAGLTQENAGLLVRERAMEQQILNERIAAEHYLVILGTLGNNAPFIGLFGTVLGIIKAFHDLGSGGSAGTKLVMAGISEALIATAVGLLVAIPAVIAYNLFLRLIKVQAARLENASRQLLTGVASMPGREVLTHGK